MECALVRHMEFAGRALDDWNELKSAAMVARLGTISAASEALGIHRATVTRHVDSVEADLGAKLFQRHARGFTPTELGIALLRIADATDAQFGELQRIARGSSDEIAGEIVVTALDVLVPFVMPIIDEARVRHPSLLVNIVSSDRVLKLEYGEAAIAFRIGRKPDHPDNVVLKVATIEMGLYAAPTYVARHGIPETPDEFGQHIFVGPDATAPRPPYFDWLEANVPDDRILVRCSNVASTYDAVSAGVGIGFLPQEKAHLGSLRSVVEPDASWHEPVWAVTHVDLHRSSKVQAVLEVARARRETES